ncbi:hypothetical protein DPPLL_23630 [Desulfofustis limnaeus]|jgi:hypothetical protein|uniref:Uncharacterized protein n=1 Tax=Desulfofustis limnaeus TaxID=2740163 RepID=A0ABN6M534_9BACT|nr:hypothetical protein DPPLL_23630 [Desulfofustis limnaeus]
MDCAPEFTDGLEMPHDFALKSTSLEKEEGVSERTVLERAKERIHRCVHINSLLYYYAHSTC